VEDKIDAKGIHTSHTSISRDGVFQLTSDIVSVTETLSKYMMRLLLVTPKPF
jgi:hypothetical protein